jgi:hypothetical protein
LPAQSDSNASGKRSGSAQKTSSVNAHLPKVVKKTSKNYFSFADKKLNTSQGSTNKSESTAKSKVREMSTPI